MGTTTITLTTMNSLIIFFCLVATTLCAPPTTTAPTTPPWTTEPRAPCSTHQCKFGEDGLFPEGSCEATFCQCYMGQGQLHHCQEGLFYDPREEVCNWPWNMC